MRNANDYGSTPVRNLLTNPGCETASGTVEVRRNLAPYPRMTSTALGVYSNATLSLVTGLVMNPDGIATAVRASYGAGASNSGAMIITSTDIQVSTTYTLSAWVFNEGGATENIAIALNGVASGGQQAVPNGVWTRLSWTYTTPASFSSAGFGVRIAVTAGGGSFIVTGVLVEARPTLGGFFDGNTAATGDFTYAWTGTANASPSTQRGFGVAGLGSLNAAVIQSGDWSMSGTKSLRIIPNANSATQDTFAFINNFTLVTGKTYTILGTLRLAAAQATAENRARKIVVYHSGTSTMSAAAPSTAGIHPVRVTFTVADGAVYQNIRFYSGASNGGGDAWWDQLMIVEGHYEGPYLDGTSDGCVWEGTAHASTSIGYPPSPNIVRNLALNPSFETGNGTVEVRRNMFQNPRAVSHSYIGGWSGFSPNTMTTTIESAPWSLSGSARRSTWTNADSANTGDVGVYVASAVDTKVTVRFRAVSNSPLTLKTPIAYSSAGVATVHAASSAVTLVPGVPAELWATITGDSVAFANGLRVISSGFTKAAGDYVEISEIDQYLGDYQPTRAWFSGSTTAAGDFTYAWTGTADNTASIQRATQPLAYTQVYYATPVVSQEWAGTPGGKSMRIIPNSSISESFVMFLGGFSTLGPLVPGKTYTALATLRLAAPLTGALYSRALSIVWRENGNRLLQVTGTNTAGTQKLRLTFTVSSTATSGMVELFNGATAGNGDVWWDDFMVVEGNYTGPYMDGSMPGMAWEGTAHASASCGYPRDPGIVTNLVKHPTPNASLNIWHRREWGASGQGGTGTVAQVATGGPNGKPFARMTWTAPGVSGTITAGPSDKPFYLESNTAYVASMWVRASKAFTGNCTTYLYGGAITAHGGASVTLVPGVWTRVTASFVSPATSIEEYWIQFRSSSGALAEVGDTLDVTMAMLTKSATVHDFHDGDTPGWRWTGTAGASTSEGAMYTLEAAAGTAPTAELTAPGTANITGKDVHSDRTLVTVVDIKDNAPAWAAFSDFGGRFTHRTKASGSADVEAYFNFPGGTANAGVTKTGGTPGRHILVSRMPVAEGRIYFSIDNGPESSVSANFGAGIEASEVLRMLNYYPNSYSGVYVGGWHNANVNVAAVTKFLANRYGVPIA